MENTPFRVSLKEVGEVCVVPKVIYGPIGGIHLPKFIFNPYLHVSNKERGEACVGPWGNYSLIEAIPSIFSDQIALIISSYYISHISSPCIYTPTTIIPDLKIHSDLYNNQLSIFGKILDKISPNPLS